MVEIEMEGKTVEEAIQSGLKKLGCSQDKVEIKILNEGSSGLFGLMGNKPSRVMLTLKDASAAPAFPVAQAKETLESILRLMHMAFTDHRHRSRR